MNDRVVHRDEDYSQALLDTLHAMQERHFWYRGRHRFVLRAVDRHLVGRAGRLDAIDLGGGAGGWVRYLAQRRAEVFGQLALADSSSRALEHAATVLPPSVRRYQADVMNLRMHEAWDMAFLLDVIEHLPDDLGALQQAREALRPGGLLFVTTPAFPQFWSYNDDLLHHRRRYRREDFARLAGTAGMRLLDARYFMFFLSPLYWLARRRKGVECMTQAQQAQLLDRTHRVPPGWINAPLTAVFAAETPLGHWLRFPWGTSVLGVFQR